MILSVTSMLLALLVFFTDSRQQYKRAENTQRQAVSEYHAGGTFTHTKTKALLRIPEFGRQYVMPIINSVSQDTLDSGVVGHFPGSGPLGVGNYALAGHVVTHGEPFAKLPDLGVGDKIIVEQGSIKYIFEVTGTLIVDYRNVSVLDYSSKTITLITCASRLFPTDERLVVRGALTQRLLTSR